MVPQPKRVEVNVGDVTVSLSNLEKLMYPRAGFTKGHVIDYYTRIAPTLLPHLRARPLTLKRYPDGVEKGFFYEKRCPSHAPSWVKTAAVWSGRNEGDIDYCLCEDLPTIVWLANLADLELHTPMARVPDMDNPTIVAFDLDPGPPATIVECAQVALELKRSFDYFGPAGVPEDVGVEGDAGVPAAEHAGRDLRGHARVLARARAGAGAADARPGGVRHGQGQAPAGKVFVDWSQNDRHKTTVNVYSLRAMEQPTVSTPLTWDEVEDMQEPLAFTSAEVLERVQRLGDLFAPVQTLEQELPR